MEEVKTDLLENEKEETKKWQTPQLKKKAQEKGTNASTGPSSDGVLLS